MHPGDRIVAAVILGKMKLVDEWCRGVAGAGERVRGEADMLLQELRLHILDGGREMGVVLADIGYLCVQFFVEVSHHLDLSTASSKSAFETEDSASSSAMAVGSSGVSGPQGKGGTWKRCSRGET